MITVTKTMWTETGHRLTNYVGRCADFHGHSYRWEVTATSPGGLDARGMVLDFKDLKFAMNEIIDPFDHAMVLSRNDPFFTEHCEGNEGKLTQALKSAQGEAPRLFLMDFNPTAENLATYALNKLNMFLIMQKITIVSVRLWETATSYAEVRND